MTSHTCEAGHPGILADDCARCAEHVAAPLLLGLDDEKTAALWDKMIAVEFDNRRRESGLPRVRYETAAEAEAASKFYLLGVWLQRNLKIDPFVPFAALQERVG